MALADDTSETGRMTRSDQVKTWDIVVRVFHWSLVLAFVLAWFTADEWDRVHEVAGYVAGGLIGLRLVWGFVGPGHAKFSSFVCKPSTVFRYLRDSLFRRAERHIGHNPAGGAMVIALMISLLVVIASGIMMTTDTFWGVDWVEGLHDVAANLTVFLIVLHVAGVIYSSIEHRENLIRSMITGFKRR